MTKTKEIRLEPIGYVERKTRNEDVRGRRLFAQVVIQPEYLKALNGIEDFSYLFIVFYMHKIPKKQKRVLKGRQEEEPTSRYRAYLQHALLSVRTP